MKNLRLVLFAIFTYLLILQVAVCVTGLRSGPKDRADFRQLYTAGYLVRSGQAHDLYNYDAEAQAQDRIVSPGSPLPFDHLAYESLLYAPFSFLKYSTAYYAFGVFNFLLLVAAQQMMRPHLSPLEPYGKLLPESVFYCFFPAAIAVIQGQDSILLLLIAVWTYRALEKGREAQAGLLLSLGLFKFQFVLPVVLLFFLWRKWRFVLGAASGALALSGLSAFVAGFAGMRVFASTMAEMSVGLTGLPQRLKFGTYPRAMPNLRGFIDAVAGTHFSAGAIQGAVIAATILVILVAYRMRPSLEVAILAAVLVSYHGLIHDSTLLALPLGIILVRSVQRKSLLDGIFGLLLFVSPAILFGSTHGLYSLMAIPLLLLLLLQRSNAGDSAPVSGLS
jgi:glycosyl transferase family 87